MLGPLPTGITNEALAGREVKMKELTVEYPEQVQFDALLPLDEITNVLHVLCAGD